MRHAARKPELLAGAIDALAITVVEATELARLVAGAGGAARPPTRLVAARPAAVDLPAITAAAEMEDRAAPPASRLPEALVHHVRPPANAGR